MLKNLGKIGLIMTPVFIASHLITENIGKIKNFCPVVKIQESNQTPEKKQK
jgi:hypothetical protein